MDDKDRMIREKIEKALDKDDYKHYKETIVLIMNDLNEMRILINSKLNKENMSNYKEMFGLELTEDDKDRLGLIEDFEWIARAEKVLGLEENDT